MPTDEEGRAEVYYDDGCPLCRAAVGWVRRRDRAGAFAFVPITQAAARAGDIPKERLAAEMHLRTEDGRVLAGAAAVEAILSRLPAGRHLAWLARLPGREWLYRLVARHRHRLWRSDEPGNRRGPEKR